MAASIAPMMSNNGAAYAFLSVKTGNTPITPLQYERLQPKDAFNF
jgi:hypothetical protein